MKDGSPQVTFQPRGRLGNVMLQTAACIGYGKKHGVPWGVPRNTREVPRFHEFFPGLPIAENHFRSYQEHPNDNFCHVHNCNKGKCWFNYHDIPFHPGGVTLAGFWQSWKYFSNAEEEVKKAFQLKSCPNTEGMVSIHVRRGDYVTYANSFPPITTAYIKAAIEHIEKTTEVYHLAVFSDDIEWCKANAHEFMFGGKHAYFFTGDEITDLSMMASCAHNIIANSTFSWWAAYLNKNPDKIVVSPSHKRGNWFGLQSGVSTDCIDLIPPSWHQIEFR